MSVGPEEDIVCTACKQNGGHCAPCEHYYAATHVVLGGLVSGDPSALAGYLEALGPSRQWLHGTDTHPYMKDWREAADLLSAYRFYDPNLEQFVFEWIRPPDEIAAYVAMLNRDTAGWCWFCWSDAMVPGFGLVDGDAWPKPEARAMSRAL